MSQVEGTSEPGGENEPSRVPVISEELAPSAPPTTEPSPKAVVVDRQNWLLRYWRRLNVPRVCLHVSLLLLLILCTLSMYHVLFDFRDADSPAVWMSITSTSGGDGLPVVQIRRSLIQPEFDKRITADSIETDIRSFAAERYFISVLLQPAVQSSYIVVLNGASEPCWYTKRVYNAYALERSYIADALPTGSISATNGPMSITFDVSDAPAEYELTCSLKAGPAFTSRTSRSIKVKYMSYNFSIHPDMQVDIGLVKGIGNGTPGNRYSVMAPLVKLDLSRLEKSANDTLHISGGSAKDGSVDLSDVNDVERLLHPGEGVEMSWDDGRSSENFNFLTLVLGALIALAASSALTVLDLLFSACFEGIKGE